MTITPKSRSIALALLLFILAATGALAQDSGFTQEDRERQIRMETTLQVFMDQTNRRFEEQRADINKRFEELRADINFRFELMDRRLEQVDRRFEQLMNFLWILVGIFTAITIGTIGFAFWDRRTSIRQARDEAIQTIEKDGRLTHLIQALREIAPKYPELAAALRKFGLL